MKYFFTILSGLVLLFFCPQSLQAKHIIGGGISYKCLGNNVYEFTIKIYRDCAGGGPALDNPLWYTIFNAKDSVVKNYFVSLATDTDVALINHNPCLVVPPGICVEEGTYVFDDTLPRSPGGYTLAYQICCRNNTIVNLNSPGSTGATYFITLNDSAMAYCNNSPVFGNYPPIVICNNTPLISDQSAYDADGDSLSYELIQANYADMSKSVGMNQQANPPPYSSVSYASPYNYLNPMGGSPPLKIDPITGLLTVTPEGIGQFVVAYAVKEYRHGVYLGTQTREFQFNVVECLPSVIASLPPELNNCASDTINFGNISTSGDTYHWDFGVAGLTSDTSNQQFPSYIYPDTGIYHVRLVVNPGLTCSDSTSTNVYIYPTLKAAMVTPIACSNRASVFTDKSVSTFNDVDAWVWNFGDKDTSHVQDPSHAYTAPGNYTVTLIVKTEKGCVDTIQQPVVVNKTPVASTPSGVIQCGGNTVQFNNTSTNAVTYLWNFGVTGTTADTSILKNSSYTFPDTGIYTVTLIADPRSVCIDSTISLVAIFPGFKAGMITPSGCLDVPVLFTDTSKSPYGIINLWKWKFGDSDSSTTKNPEHVYDTAGNYTVSLKVKNTKGCIDSVTRTIIIYPTPLVNALPKDSSICDKDSIQLSAIEEGSVSYVWSPNYNIITTTSQSPVVFPKVTTTYFASVTDNHGCIGKDSLTVKVFDTLYAHVNMDTIICPGGEAQLKGSGFGAYFYWSPTNSLVNPAVLNPVANPGATTTYTFTEAAGSCIAMDRVVVIVKPFPVIGAGADQNICFGDTTILTASGGTSYIWSPNEDLTNTTGATTRAFPGETTIYYVFGKDSTKCAVTVFDSLTIQVNHPDATSISADTTIIDGTFAFPFAVGGTAYHWRPVQGLSNPNVANPRANPTQTTTYYVNIVTPDGCIATDSVVITVVVEPIIKFPSAFSPNGDGNNDRYHPIVVGPLNNYIFRIYNRWGQMVYSSENQNDEGWDGTFKGKIQDVGVYDYYFEGTSVATGNQFKNKGNITLLR